MGYIEDIRAIVGTRPLILVGSVVIMTNPGGQILLQQRTSPHGVWGLPGGLMELGESTEEVARREVLEETGLTVDHLRLLDVYSGADYFTKAPNGDEFYVVTTAYHTESYEGELRAEPEESLQLQFTDPDRLPDKMVGSHKEMIMDFIANRTTK